jgi:hypothetical protein
MWCAVGLIGAVDVESHPTVAGDFAASPSLVATLCYVVLRRSDIQRSKGAKELAA